MSCVSVSKPVHIIGRSIAEAHEQHICIACGKKIHELDSEISFYEAEEGQIWSWEGARHYNECGLCEFCYEYISQIDEVREKEREEEEEYYW